VDAGTGRLALMPNMDNARDPPTIKKVEWRFERRNSQLKFRVHSSEVA